MKRPVYFLVILSILLFACNISTTATPPEATPLPLLTVPPVATVPPVVTEKLVDTVTPEMTATLIPTNLTCNELSLYLDPTLASGYKCETVAESAEGIEIAPQYTLLTLEGYILSG
jgi:hypothetical protein